MNIECILFILGRRFEYEMALEIMQDESYLEDSDFLKDCHETCILVCHLNYIQYFINMFFKEL